MYGDISTSSYYGKHQPVIGVLCGLLAALTWGTADFLARFGSHRLGERVALLAMQLAGGGVLLLIVLLVGRPLPEPDELLIAALLGVLNLAGYLLLYRALARGVLSVVSPIISSYAVVAVGLAILDGERPSALALGGIALTLVGVALAGMQTGDGRTVAGVPAALGATLLLGVLFWALGDLSQQADPLWAVTVLRLATAALLLPFTTLAATRVRDERRGFAIATAAGLCDASAFVAYAVGTSESLVAIVAPLAGLFGAVVVLLARVVLGERLARRQKAGLAAIFTGVVVVSAGL